jgi:tRNA (mo5U34)-methyltransferase
MFADPSWPQAYFIEQRYSNDHTNWWIPNRAAAEAMLRSSGLVIESHPESETWICTPDARSREGDFVLSMELDGTL